MASEEASTTTREMRFSPDERVDILAAWRQAVRALPFTDRMSEPALLDDMPYFFDALNARLEPGARAAHVAMAVAATAQHLLTRLDEGLDLSQVIAEYSILRRCIGARWCMGSDRDVDELCAFHESVDEAILAAVEHFTAARDRTLQALDRVSTAALECRHIDEFLQRLLGVLGETTEAVDVAALFLRDGDFFRLRASVGLDDDVRRSFAVRVGEGFAGTIAKVGHPMEWHEASTSPLALSEVFRAKGVHALYGAPLFAGDELIGVAHMGSCTALDFSSQDKRLFMAMVHRATAATFQHMLREVAEEQVRVSRFFAETTAVFSASLDYETTIKSIARVVVAHVADICIFDMLDADGRVRRVEVAGNPQASGRGIALTDLDGLLAQGPNLQHASPIQRVLAQGRAELTLYQEAMWGGACDDPNFLDLVRRVRPMASITVPLRARERTVGAMTLLRLSSSYGHRDQGLAMELAGRAAMAVDNALLYQEARQAVQIREHVLSVVSHDLRNPLGAILLNTELLRRRTAPHDRDGRLRTSVVAIRRSAERMNWLIEDMLDLTSLQSGQLSLTCETHDGAAVLEEIVESFAESARQRSIRLEMAIAPDVRPITCDHGRILQVLANLVDNAIKATDVGGRIELRLENASADMVRFAVCDTGRGIAAADLGNIFKLYWRSPTSKYKGTGLGLATAQGIIGSHGGKIWAESTLGQGTTLFFTLRAADLE